MISEILNIDSGMDRRLQTDRLEYLDRDDSGERRHSGRLAVGQATMRVKVSPMAGRARASRPRTSAFAIQSGLCPHVAAKAQQTPLLRAPPRRGIVRIPRQLGVRAINVADRKCLLTRRRPAEEYRHDIDVGFLVAVTGTGDRT
jgi:hypothetical protein